MSYKDPNKEREYKRKYNREWRKRNPKRAYEIVKKSRKKHHNKELAGRKRWYQKHKKEQLEKAKERKIKQRKIVIEHYGSKCSCCGENQYEFLTIEHKNGGGCKHRKKIGAASMARFIIKNNFPPEYDILCYNCNCAKAFSGICPHKKDIKFKRSLNNKK